MKLVSWNVNGIRAALKKGFLDQLDKFGADVICLQETKAMQEQVADVDWPPGYHQFWNAAEKKGYSGTAVFAKEKPEDVTFGMGVKAHDQEGRVINVEYGDFYLVNVYTPNSQNELARLDYRTQEWDVAFREHVKKLEKRKPAIFCGDLNVAHQEIDLARPKFNTRNAGFTQEERDSFAKHLEAGFVDTFREFEKDGGHYSWWSYRANARAKNIGWRIDYFCVSESLRSRLESAAIMPEVMGSDHCPVVLELS
ncbi:MAG: Exodeoxyribonuclease [Verrucomicrobia subdivision 3 bacterium]|nr:Exodeoxyribonuclease [Limisphaerales bacterium]MCS1415790.1 Exodeoxyribonuclease [Limisphaerales bacterium]